MERLSYCSLMSNPRNSMYNTKSSPSILNQLPPFTCPKCKTAINIQDINLDNANYKLSFTCERGHRTSDLSLNEYLLAQLDQNSKNLSSVACKLHDNKPFIAYCPLCKEDLCQTCINDHNDHVNEILYYNKFLPNVENKKKFINNKQKELDDLNKVQDITNQWLTDLQSKINQNFENQKNILLFQKNFAENFDPRKTNYNQVRSMNFLTNQIKVKRNAPIKSINDFNQINYKIHNFINQKVFTANDNIPPNSDSDISDILKYSDIIKTEENLELLKSFFPPSRVPRNVEKLYNAKENNGSAQSFHSCCDGKGPTLTLVKTDKNCVFGGYTEKDWGVVQQKKMDPKSFVFNLNSKKKYQASKGNGIYLYKDYGPYFHGNNDSICFVLSNDCTNNRKSFTDGCRPDSFEGAKLQEMSKPGKEYFKVDEYEVYRVIY